MKFLILTNIICLFLLQLFFVQNAYSSDNLKQSLIYVVYANLGLIKKDILNVKTFYLESSESYEIQFTLLSQGGWSEILIGETQGEGVSKGIVDKGSLNPEYYRYKELKKNKEKIYEIKFNKNITIGKRIPAYDKNKLTPITNEMLKEVIDPALAFHLISDYANTNKCSRKFKVYDAKRRFDLDFYFISNINNEIICEIKQSKIGGYKIKDSLNPLEIPNIMNIKYIYNNGKFSMKTIKGKNDFLNLTIELNGKNL